MDDAGHSNDLRNGSSNSCHHPFKQQVLNQSTFNETSNFAIAVLNHLGCLIYVLQSI